jgi:hypothetical protein
MNANAICSALESAIAEYTGDTGPICWTAEEQDDKFLLIGKYPASTRNATGDCLEEEPWTVYGGDMIIRKAGLQLDSCGMDAYQDKWGDDMVAQWVSFNAEEDY